MRDNDSLILEGLYLKKVLLSENRINQINDRYIETDDGNIWIIQLSKENKIYVEIQGFISNIDEYLMDVLDEISKDQEFSKYMVNFDASSDNEIDISGFGKKTGLDTSKVTNTSDTLLTFGPFLEIYESSEFIKKLDNELSMKLTGYISKNGKGDIVLNGDIKEYKEHCDQLSRDYSGLIYTLNKLGNFPDVLDYVKKLFHNIFSELCFDMSSKKTDDHLNSIEIMQNKNPLFKITKDSLMDDYIPKLILHGITSFNPDFLENIENNLIKNYKKSNETYIAELYKLLFRKSMKINNMSHFEKIEIIDDISDKVNELVESNPYLKLNSEKNK
jgi:hypothetical protein